MSDNPVESRADEQSTNVERIFALLFVLLTAACADVSRAPPSGPPQTGATHGGAAAVEPGGREAKLPTPAATGQSETKTDSPVWGILADRQKFATI
jgi:hypothetical protein